MKIKTAALVALIGVCLALLGQFYDIFNGLKWMISDEFNGFGFMYIAETVVKTLTWAALACFFYMLYKKS